MLDAGAIAAPVPTIEALTRLMASPDIASRRWVYEHYDHVIGGDTVQKPGGDAAVVRIDGGAKALALTTDVTPRYCAADPFEGGKQAVAEAWRNITAVGGEPLALTDNLNFGSPQRPEIMGQFVGCVRGIGEAARALAFPVVSGNVSLYNENKVTGNAILPTPAIGGVGLLPDWRAMATIAFKRRGETILLAGRTDGWLGASIWLREIAGREDGAPPPVDLDREKRVGDAVRTLIRAGQVTACHDVSDGGVLVTVTEMALAGDIGARLASAPRGMPEHAFWFGEDQARYVLTVTPDARDAVIAALSAAGVETRILGRTAGTALTLPRRGSISLSEIRHGWEGWFEAFMSEAA